MRDGQDEKVFGFLTLGSSRDADIDQTTGEIWGIYLAPEHWRKGIGRMLYLYGERILRERGYLAATLWVFAGNEQARRFYETMNFKEDGTSKVINVGAPLKAIRYHKDFLL